MKEYKILRFRGLTPTETEIHLNNLARSEYRLIAVNEYFAFLERDTLAKTEDDTP